MTDNPDDGVVRLHTAKAKGRTVQARAMLSDPLPTHGLPAGCPVSALGMAGTDRYYLDSKRQMVVLAAEKHTRLNMLGLFSDQKEFPYSVDEWTRKNDKGTITGIRPEAMAEDLMAACAAAGIWDANERERGRGAWRGDDGELILHLGDRVQVYNASLDAWGLRQVFKPGLIGRYVYPAAERAGTPAEGPSPPDSVGEHVLDLLGTWNWRRGDLDAVLMLGWIGAAMIGGALKWRPAVWMTGGKGTGKSTLQDAVRHMFGDAVLALADTSGAAIWQTLRHQTLPVAVDELEADEDNRKQLAVVKIARLAASGGRLARGSDRHQAVEFVLRSSFLFSSVLVPPLMGPDRSRLAMLELNDLGHDKPLPDLAPARLRDVGAQLRRRMIDGWPRFEMTLESYRRRLSEAGHSARGADQFGTLLACADILLFQQFDAGAADDWTRRMQVENWSETADDLRDEDQCLQFLLGAQLDPFRNSTKANLGEWINRAAGRVHDYLAHKEAMDTLRSYGVRLEFAKDGSPPKVAIANQHPQMVTIFERSRWKTPHGVMGVWVQALRRLPGAERGSKPLYFGGPISKVTLLPLSAIPAPDPHP